jgi:hypothetical protein
VPCGLGTQLKRDSNRSRYNSDARQAMRTAMAIFTDIRTMCTREEFEKRYRGQSPYAARTEQSGRGR